MPNCPMCGAPVDIEGGCPDCLEFSLDQTRVPRMTATEAKRLLIIDDPEPPLEIGVMRKLVREAAAWWQKYLRGESDRQGGSASILQPNRPRARGGGRR